MGLTIAPIEKVAVPNGIPLVSLEQVNNELKVVKGDSDVISGEFLRNEGC